MTWFDQISTVAPTVFLLEEPLPVRWLKNCGWSEFRPCDGSRTSYSVSNEIHQDSNFHRHFEMNWRCIKEARTWPGRIFRQRSAPSNRAALERPQRINVSFDLPRVRGICRKFDITIMLLPVRICLLASLSTLVLSNGLVSFLQRPDTRHSFDGTHKNNYVIMR